MKDQHEKIKGYRDLTQDEIDLMNEGKALAERCGDYIAKLRGYVPQNMSGPEGGEAVAFAPGGTLDQRWISIGAIDLQRGFMAVIRGIERSRAPRLIAVLEDELE